MLACGKAKASQRKAIAPVPVDVAALHIDITDRLCAKGEAYGVDRLCARPAAGPNKAGVAGTVGPVRSPGFVEINVDVRAATIIKFARKLIIEHDRFKLKEIGRRVVIGHASRPVLAPVSGSSIDFVGGVNHTPSTTVRGHVTTDLKGVVAARAIRINPVWLVCILAREFERLAGQSRVALRAVSSA